MRTERERQAALAANSPYAATYTFELSDGSKFSALATSRSGAIRVLAAERSGVTARFIGFAREIVRLSA